MEVEEEEEAGVEVKRSVEVEEEAVKLERR